ncbi:MAG: hypothetical protein ACXVEB_17720, partial [Bacteroidia bacterium]
DKGEKGVFMVIDQKIYLILEQKDSCNLDRALLQHLDGTPLTVEEYDRIHRFIRLWRKLGWTMDETDQAIVGLSHKEDFNQSSRTKFSLCEICGEDDCHHLDCEECNCEDEKVHFIYDINPQLIHQLVAVKKLLNLTGLELIKLLSFWSDISTFGEKSLYQQLFLTHNVLGIDKIFLQADDNGNYLSGDAKLLDHIPAVMAALNLSADDIHEIMQKKGMENKLTLSNLSILYRYRLLSKVLGLRIPAFLSILPLYENYENMFQDANMTLTFMNRWAKMESSGFTYQQLNYIINDKDDVLNPLGPTEKTILQLSKTLYDGLNAIDEEHKDLKADDSISDPVLQKINILEQATSELVRTKVSLLFESDTVEKIMGILEGTNVYTNKAPKDLDFTLPDSSTLKKKLKYDKTLGSIQITGILTQQSTGQSEVDEYKAISNSSEWVKALACIQKQQEKLFKELLSGIFESEHTIPVAAKEKIMMGDIMIPFDKIPNGEEDPNTAPKKRAVFLEVFLPYLRQQLSHRFVIDTLANFIELGSKVTNVLVSEVLKLDSSDKPIYSI